ncbi:MAG: SMI1/KNR4 family protein [Myxococcales bacterium]
MRSSVAQLVKSLGAVWARRRPEIWRGLRPGASAARIDALAAHFDLTLPSAFRKLYAWHDGLRDEHTVLEGEFGWLSLSRMKETKKALDRMERQGFFSDYLPGSWWNISWLPFLQFNLEDHYCVDLGGALGRGRGVVFLRRNSDPRRLIVASSFHAWLHAHVELTSAGPDDADEDAWIEYFASRRASRIRRALDPGFPIAVTAKRGCGRAWPAGMAED